MPSMYSLIGLAGIQERFAWRRGRSVLGINARNLLYVHRLNPRRHYPLADDKVLTKRVFRAARVPCPETLAVLRSLSEVARARPLLVEAGEFAVKPARGRQGGGIIIIEAVTENDGEVRFRRTNGTLVSWDDLRRAMGDILFGVHSGGRPDVVMIERRIHPDRSLAGSWGTGLPDIRVILLDGEPAMAMMRIPTLASEGKANLHQGALGVGIRLADGRAIRCMHRGLAVETHPDTGAPVTGFVVPRWEEVLQVARVAAAATPLPYLGVDIVLDEHRGPMVMEINVRPGLEIQNVNGRGLRRRLACLSARARSRA